MSPILAIALVSVYVPLVAIANAPNIPLAPIDKPLSTPLTLIAFDPALPNALINDFNCLPLSFNPADKTFFKPIAFTDFPNPTSPFTPPLIPLYQFFKTLVCA